MEVIVKDDWIGEQGNEEMKRGMSTGRIGWE